MFYGFWLLSATRAFRADCRVKLIIVAKAVHKEGCICTIVNGFTMLKTG